MQLRLLALAGITGLMCAHVTPSHAAGFALIEQSASGMGNAFAGAAASAEDASTIFFNPAGMAYLQGRQIVGALHAIRPSAKFDNAGSIAGFGRPLGDEGGDAGSLAFVPNFYYSMEFSPAIRLGLGINAPFGLKTDFDSDWMGRFQADKSELKTININPSLSFRVNDQLSLGFGVSAMRAEAELTRTVNLVAAESAVKIEGDDWGLGYNLGAILQATQDTRIGIAYRSRVIQHLDGKAKFDAPITALSGNVKADVTLPETLSISLFSRLNERWDIMADATWTRWNRFEKLEVVRDSGATLALTPENWENTMRYSVGANYRYNDAWKLRIGVAHDEEPIKDEFRTARIPGEDRVWLALGAGWQMSEATKLDFGYAHLFVKDASIDDNQTPVNGRLRGDFENQVNILSAQFTYSF